MILSGILAGILAGILDDFRPSARMIIGLTQIMVPKRDHLRYIQVVKHSSRG
jgi:hypothetical protein